MQKEIEQHVALAKQGSHEDIEYIFKAFKKSIETCAYKLRTPYFDFEDAVQEGNIGLFKAILSFSPDNGASFNTYAKKCILNNIITAYNTTQSHKHQILNTAKSLDEEDFQQNLIFWLVWSLQSLYRVPLQPLLCCNLCLQQVP